MTELDQTRGPRRPRPDDSIKTPVEYADLPTWTRERCTSLSTNQKHLLNDGLFRLRRRIEADLARKRLPEGRRRRLERELDTVGAVIVDVNYGLVKDYAVRFSKDGTGVRQNAFAADYEAAGEVGLIRAMNSFDPDKGVFGDWAYKYIKREVLEQVRRTEFPALTNADFERRPTVKSAHQHLKELHGKDPDLDAVAEETGLSRQHVESILRMPVSVSLQDNIGSILDSDDGMERGDLVSVTDSDIGTEMTAREILQRLMENGLSKLSVDEQVVLIQRLGLDGDPPKNLSVVGQSLDPVRSRETVRQMERRAIAKLQHPVVMREVMGLGDVDRVQA